MRPENLQKYFKWKESKAHCIYIEDGHCIYIEKKSMLNLKKKTVMGDWWVIISM